MTFQDYASTHASLRVITLIDYFDITEYTPYSHIIKCGGIGQRSAQDIEQLQQDYIKTFDVAYQQVIQYIRNEMIS